MREFAFGPPPARGGPADRERVENLACRQVLRAKGESPAAVSKAAGLPPSAPLTFALLAEHAGFPRRPAVTGVPPDPLNDFLAGDARRTRLWAEWVAAWDGAPEVRPGERVLVAEGVGWGRVAVHDNPAVLSTRPGVVIHAGRTTLVLEVLKPWALAVWGDE